MNQQLSPFTSKQAAKLIILDRDGVINFDSKDFIKSEAEWVPIPGSLEAIAALNQHGFKVVVASNQSGIARGYFDLETLNRIHQKMQTALKAKGGNVDGIYICPHGPLDHCACRKPKPGLYLEISRDYGIDFSTQRVIAIGDSLRDLEAALAANCDPILVLTGNGKETVEKLNQVGNNLGNADNLSNIPRYTDLSQAVQALLKH